VDIEISVMTPLQKIDDYKKIRLGTDGVIFEKIITRRFFFPRWPLKPVWNLDQFLGHLCQKAGLPTNAYKSGGMEFLIFQALVLKKKKWKNENKEKLK